MSLLPPRWLRRVVLDPVLLVVALVVLALSPLILMIAALCSPLVSGRWRPLRVTAFSLIWLLHEFAAVILCAVSWLVAMGRLQTPTMQARHYAAMGWFLGNLRAWSTRLLNVRVTVVGDDEAERVLAAGQEPVLVLSRHAGPGDTFYLVDALLARYARRPSIVMKEILQLDPCIDLAGNRLPNYFVPPRSRRQDGSWERCIGELSRSLAQDGALVLFPEGGNFTEERRRRRLRALLQRGRRGEAERAVRMHHVIAPEPGGALTAISAKPDLGVILVAHSGLSGLDVKGGLVRRAPMDQELRVRFWHVGPSAIPAGDEPRRAWLLDSWQLIDRWVGENT